MTTDQKLDLLIALARNSEEQLGRLELLQAQTLELLQACALKLTAINERMTNPDDDESDAWRRG